MLTWSINYQINEWKKRRSSTRLHCCDDNLNLVRFYSALSWKKWDEGIFKKKTENKLLQFIRTFGSMPMCCDEHSPPDKEKRIFFLWNSNFDIFTRHLIVRLTPFRIRFRSMPTSVFFCWFIEGGPRKHFVCSSRVVQFNWIGRHGKRRRNIHLIRRFASNGITIVPNKRCLSSCSRQFNSSNGHTFFFWRAHSTQYASLDGLIIVVDLFFIFFDIRNS